MKKLLLVAVFSGLILASCLSPESRANLGAREREVAALEAKLQEALAAGTSDTTELRAQLAAASEQLQAARAAGVQERIESGAGIGATIAETLSPLAAFLGLPFAGGLLALAGTKLRGLAGGKK